MSKHEQVLTIGLRLLSTPHVTDPRPQHVRQRAQRRAAVYCSGVRVEAGEDWEVWSIAFWSMWARSYRQAKKQSTR